LKRENAVLLHFFSKIATTWINMQDAYFQEKNEVGDWAEIGCSAPGAGSFYSYESNVFKYSGSADGTMPATWLAEPKQKLNVCSTEGKWALSATNSGDATDNIYPSFNITDGGSTPVCKALIASWDKLAGSH
jgi:hypothetical protein